MKTYSEIEAQQYQNVEEKLVWNNGRVGYSDIRIFSETALITVLKWKDEVSQVRWRMAPRTCAQAQRSLLRLGPTVTVPAHPLDLTNSR